MISCVADIGGQHVVDRLLENFSGSLWRFSSVCLLYQALKLTSSLSVLKPSLANRAWLPALTKR